MFNSLYSNYLKGLAPKGKVHPPLLFWIKWASFILGPILIINLFWSKELTELVQKDDLFSGLRFTLSLLFGFCTSIAVFIFTQIVSYEKNTENYTTQAKQKWLKIKYTFYAARIGAFHALLLVVVSYLNSTINFMRFSIPVEIHIVTIPFFPFLCLFLSLLLVTFLIFFKMLLDLGDFFNYILP